MHEHRARTAPIPYEHYQAEAVRLRREAIRRPVRPAGAAVARRPARQGYGAVSGAGCGQ